MSEKSKTVINQLYRYYKAEEREDGEWFLPELPIRESQAQGLTFLAIAEQLQQLVAQLRLPAEEWIEVTPETLPPPHRVCGLTMGSGQKIFSAGSVDEEGKWYLYNFPKEQVWPLYYVQFPDMTREMQERWEEEWFNQEESEEL